jgi:AraC-like DNA-binding protein
MADFQRHGRPISDVWFKARNQTSSVSSEIRIGGLSLIAVRSDPVCFNSVPDAHLSLVLPTIGSGVISDGISSARWTGAGHILRTSHQRPVEFAYESMSIVTIRPDFADLAREARRLFPSFAGFVDRLKESRSAALAPGLNGTDYAGMLLKLLRIIDDCAGDRALLQRIRIDTAITRLIVSLIAQQAGYAAPGREPAGRHRGTPKIDVVCDGIQSSIGTPLTVGDMEDLSGLPAQELAAAFSSRFGCTPQEWQRNCLLDRARHLLSSRENTPSIGSVSRELGFSSAGSFSAHYRKRFGELPSHTRSAPRGSRRH